MKCLNYCFCILCLSPSFFSFLCHTQFVVPEAVLSVRISSLGVWALGNMKQSSHIHLGNSAGVVQGRRCLVRDGAARCLPDNHESHTATLEPRSAIKQMMEMKNAAIKWFDFCSAPPVPYCHTHTQTTHTPNLSQALFITHYALNTLTWLRAGSSLKLTVYTIEHSLCILVLFF